MYCMYYMQAARWELGKTLKQSYTIQFIPNLFVSFFVTYRVVFLSIFTLHIQFIIFTRILNIFYADQGNQMVPQMNFYRRKYSKSTKK